MELYTIGYEGKALDGFLDQLAAAGVRQVLDTRELPLSRRRGFSKAPLSEALAARGIGYVHMKALGTPKPLRDAHKKTHDHAALQKAYAALLDERLPALHQAYQLALTAPTALLCFEADPGHCHRQVLARRMQALFRDPEPVTIVDL